MRITTSAIAATVVIALSSAISRVSSDPELIGRSGVVRLHNRDQSMLNEHPRAQHRGRVYGG
jgi:hypothetical protein